MSDDKAIVDKAVEIARLAAYVLPMSAKPVHRI